MEGERRVDHPHGYLDVAGNYLYDGREHNDAYDTELQIRVSNMGTQ